MKHLFKYILLRVCIIRFYASFMFLLPGIILFAQDASEIIVKIETDSINQLQLLEHINSNYQFLVFYNLEWFEKSVKEKWSSNGQHLDEVLKAFFTDKGYQVIYRNGHAIIVDFMIYKSFAKDFSQRMNKKGPDYQEEAGFAEPSVNEYDPDAVIIRFGIPDNRLNGRKFNVSGKILDKKTGLPVIGATVNVSGTLIGAVSDIEGNYNVSVPAGNHELNFRAIGKKITTRNISIYAKGELDIELEEEAFEIEQVIIVAKVNDRVNTLSGAERLDIGMMKKSVMMMGESDIIKGMLALPGVQTTTEVATGFNVRGGSTDQNLVLLDNAPVINTTHFFGFFSAFNSEFIRNATLYKSGIPANMGGRISSIFDISARSGSMKEFIGKGGISPVTGRLTLEGPVVKDKVSLLIGGRSTYSDWILKRIEEPRIKNSSASFYDVYGKLKWDIAEGHDLSFTVYKSFDQFRFDELSASEYANELYALNYRIPLSSSMTLHHSMSTSNYKFNITDESIPSSANSTSYELIQYSAKEEFRLKRNKFIDLKFGISGTYYNVKPGNLKPFGDESLIEPVELSPEKGIETAFFIHNEHDVNNWLSVSYGLRYSGYTGIGPQDIYSYETGLSPSLISLEDTIIYSPGSIIDIFSGPEYRILAKISTGVNSSLKLSFNRTRQYINLISNTITPAPTDIWKLSDIHFKPQSGDQYSVGFYKNLRVNSKATLSLSAEGYYKETQNILDYKVGAELFANDHFETEIMSGENRAYGVEFQVLKENGVLTGWLNYAYSRSLNKFDSSFPEETLNSGNYFPANFDKPHNIKAIVNYDFYRRLRLSINMNYSSGRPVTLPQSSFNYGGSKKVQFADRNQYRLPDYFRLDLSATLEGNYKIDKLVHSSLTLSVINITGRKNPYSVFFNRDTWGKIDAYYLSIFGVPVFTLTYNFEF